ncbi:hypothetical protein EV644_10529 [Kribbella orskensis]|uniref:Uncharacterized protein n=1 Tax=Kribbella orskensis TaxID=2512216 RepID=A0ABY2BMR0_9ACTN|nr:hypothetical protein EV642_10429 [Kribbella sp. VKM Ac-2500]TCO23999.1 hypothetical protein EV644_10529 [Kribbella orskensis]
MAANIDAIDARSSTTQWAGRAVTKPPISVLTEVIASLNRKVSGTTDRPSVH